MFALIQRCIESFCNTLFVDPEIVRIFRGLLFQVCDHSFAAGSGRRIDVRFDLFGGIVLCEILYLFSRYLFNVLLHGVRIDVAAECFFQFVLVYADHVLEAEAFAGLVVDVLEGLAAEDVDVLV